MNAEYLKCRNWRHAWEDFLPGVGDRKPAPYGRGMSLRCTRCTTERHDCYDSRGELASRSYVYPKDYQLSADERPSIETLRLALVRDLKSEHLERMNARAQRRAPRTPKKQRRLQAVS